MKKILTIIGLVSVTTLLHAQGYVEWAGTSAAISTNTGTFLLAGGETSGVNGKTASSVSQSYDYALLWAASTPSGGTQATNAGWNLAEVSGAPLSADLATNYANPGALEGIGGTGGTNFIGMNASVTYSVMIVGWSANLGSSWLTVSNELYTGDWTLLSGTMGFFGETGVGTMTPTATPAGQPGPFGGSAFANGSLVLYEVPVPEPATIALAGLGGLSMLLLRRRNKA
jgi:hypothetical protein